MINVILWIAGIVAALAVLIWMTIGALVLITALLNSLGIAQDSFLRWQSKMIKSAKATPLNIFFKKYFESEEEFIADYFARVK